jgi:UDP-N-acetylglucosamine 1-carboxyvinyltransferase
MDRFVIRGGVPLRGSVEVSGSKNAVLALMAAGMLTNEEVTFRNVPRVRDVVTMGKILEQLGIAADFDGDRLVIGSGEPNSTEAPYDLVRTMRASFMVLGPLLARCGQARVSLPGGCAIGARPVDQHLKGLEALGAKIELAGGYVEARADRLRGGRVVFDMATVNGTQNVLMAACLATGTTLIENAALEPEVEELIDVLVAMGAQIDGAGTDRLEVQGVDELCGLDHSVSGDRIEAATLIMALAITRGSGVVERIRPKHLTAVIGKLQEAEVALEVEEGRVRVREGGPLRAIRVKTSPYPGYPTDAQAQMMALLSLAEGSSLVTETIFENRFMHVSELTRMGADIHVDGRTAVIQGVRELSGAPVMATDLRASASLVLAGLAARGETHINRVYHIDRGYERIEQKLGALGARISRERV